MTQCVVVGVDGSPAAAAALTWAAREARLRGAELVAWMILDQPQGTPAAETAAPHTPRSVLQEFTDRQALRVAAEEARLRGMALHVIHAVHRVVQQAGDTPRRPDRQAVAHGEVT
jgi:nucleotide-binding universal stress UspA family protein